VASSIRNATGQRIAVAYARMSASRCFHQDRKRSIAAGEETLKEEIVTKIGRLISVSTLAVFLAGSAFAQTDPGVQSGNRGTGAALPSVLQNDNPGILAFFTDGQARFQEVESVSGGANNGLGPRFNSNQCSSCHTQPAVGGTGAAVNPNSNSPATESRRGAPLRISLRRMDPLSKPGSHSSLTRTGHPI